MSRKFLRIAALTAALALAFAGSAMAAEKTSAAAGNWNAGGTWVGGAAPVAGDKAIIKHAVTVNAAGAAAKEVELADGGSLTITAAGLAIDADGQLSATADATVNVNVANGLTFGGATNNVVVAPGKTLTIAGANPVIGNPNPAILSGGGTLKLDTGLTNATSLSVKDKSKVELNDDAANVTKIDLEKNAVLDLKFAQTVLNEVAMQAGAVANFSDTADGAAGLKVTGDASAVVNVEALGATSVTFEVDGPTVNMKKVNAGQNITTLNIKKGKVISAVAFPFGPVGFQTAPVFTPVAATCDVTVFEGAELLLSADAAFKEIKKDAGGAGSLKSSANLYAVAGGGNKSISLPLDAVTVIPVGGAPTYQISSKVGILNAMQLGANAPTIELLTGAEIGELYAKRDTDLAPLKVTDNASIGSLKFDTDAAGLKVDVANNKTLSVGMLEKAAGETLVATNTILDLNNGGTTGTLLLGDGKGTTKGKFVVTDGTLRVEKAEALLGADEVNVAANKTLSLANGLTLLTQLKSGNPAKLIVDLVEANVGTDTPALTVKGVVGPNKWDLSGLQIPKTMAVDDKVCVLKTTDVALDAGLYDPVVLNTKVEVANFNTLYLKATKAIPVMKLTPVSLTVTPGVEFKTDIKVSDVVSTDVDWDALPPALNAVVIKGDSTQSVGVINNTSLKPVSSDMKFEFSFFPKGTFVSFDVKVDVPLKAGVAGFPGSVVLKLSKEATLEPDKLTASLTASKPTVKVGETVEFELGKWQYKGAEVEVQDVKWELDGVDKTADVVAGKLPAKAEKEGTMTLVVTAKLKSDPTVVGKATASVTVTKDGGSTGGTGGSGGGGGCDAGFAGLALLLAAPLFLRKKD